MKYTITLFAALLLGSTCLVAQNFAYDSVQHNADTIEAGEFRGFRVDLWTPDSSGIQFKWTRISNTLSDEWSYSLCDYQSCYPGVPGGGTMSPITNTQFANGQTAFFRLLIATSDSLVTTGKVTIYVYDASNPNTGDTISFSLTTVLPVEDTSDVSGISAVAGEDVLVYPNPTNDRIWLEGKNLDRVAVYDMAGAAVLTREALTVRKLSLDLNELSPGIYTVAVYDGVNTTHKRIIKH